MQCMPAAPYTILCSFMACRSLWPSEAAVMGYWGLADLGAFEGHVLQKVCSSIVVVCLITAPSINPDTYRGCLCKGGGL